MSKLKLRDSNYRTKEMLHHEVPVLVLDLVWLKYTAVQLLISLTIEIRLHTRSHVG